VLTPYPYQRRVIDRFKGENKVALLIRPGAGKTLIALFLLKHWYNLHGVILPTVIFAPPVVLEKWRREIAQCTKIPDAFVGVVMGTKNQRLKILDDKKKKIIIINYEATRSQDILIRLIGRGFKVVICDESHKFKSPKLKTPAGKLTQTGAIFNISSDSRYRIIMTGTPNPQPEAIWSQYFFLDRGEVFHERFYHFKSEYFINRNANWDSQKAYPDWQFIASKADKYRSNLAKYAATVDEVELPDLVEDTIEIEPSPEMLKHYKNINKQLITWVENQEDNPMTVRNALTKVLRLNEILSGHVRLEDETVHMIEDNSTLDGLMELIDSLHGAKVIVYTVYKPNYKLIADRLKKAKITYVEIHGGVSAKKKIENQDLFNDSDYQVCINNPASGGIGIDLISAQYTIYYSMNESLIDYEQSRARNYRAGSIKVHKKITHYYLIHKGMITEKILYALKNKKNLADSLLDIKGLLNGSK